MCTTIAWATDGSASAPAVLVISNRGHGSVCNLLLGRTATRLPHGASLPIIAVPSASISPWTGVQPAQPGHPVHHQRADLVVEAGCLPLHLAPGSCSFK
ncbi:hypothetical protein ACWEOZ_21020 [Actinoplanes sp. NPDC004185]